MDTNSLIHTDALKDKSLWLAVLAPVLVMAGKILGVELNPETILAVVGPIVAFIISSKAKQASVAKAVSMSAAGLDKAEEMLKDAEVK